MNVFGIIRLVTLAAFTMGASGLQAQNVTLNSMDGTLSVSGVLKDYNREFYILSSNIGDLTISTSVVTCSGEACPSLLPKYTEFSISGSRELSLNLMPLLLDGFSASLGLDLIQQTDDSGNQEFLFATVDGEDIAKISFILRGSSNGLKDLMTGRAAMALTTRAARPSEEAAYSAAGLGALRSGANEHILALDGIVVVTSPINTVRIIKHSDLAGIFSGQITDWAQIGGIPGPINLYIRPENSATGARFSQLILRPARARLSRGANALESDAAVTDAVSADPNGIGFTSFSSSANAQTISLLGTCGIQSPATEFTIQAEEYPYTRRLYLYTNTQDVPPIISQFLDYMKSSEAQKLIDLAGYVGQDVEEIPVNDQGLRFLSAALPTDAEMTLVQLQAMMQDLAISERVSVTYRFEQGTAQLDSRAQADIGRLVDEILQPDFQNKTVILMGFTDSIGNGPNNERLSLARAEQVRQAILQAAGGAIPPEQIEVRGYGELSPLGCNEVVEGRRINRRVEVWER